MKYLYETKEDNATKVGAFLGRLVVAIAIAYLIYRMILEPIARGLVG